MYMCVHFIHVPHSSEKECPLFVRYFIISDNNFGGFCQPDKGVGLDLHETAVRTAIKPSGVSIPQSNNTWWPWLIIVYFHGHKI